MDGSLVETDYPVVLRFEGLYPHNLAGYEAHRLRRGGDLGHVDRSRSDLNERLIGSKDWAVQALAEIRRMTDENFADELEALEKRNRKKDIERRIVEGPKQPWRPTRHGPMREVIVTVHKGWFAGDISGFLGEEGNAREEAFQDYAVVWLKKNFGDDVIHARADRDEAAYHVHAVIMPKTRVEIAKPKAKVPTAPAKRWMLQPSKHPLIKDYEAAQDSVGRHFAPLGLVRGEKRAEAIRKARAKGEEPPKRRHHAKTWQWRAEEELRLVSEAAALEQRTTRVEEREAEAETVLAVAEGVASGALVADGEGESATLVAAPQRSDAKPDTPDLDALRKRSPKGVARAAGIFGRAWTCLFGEARATAETEARAGVADAMAEIAEADERIVEAALRLPLTARAAIARIRSTVPAILRRLERSHGIGAASSTRTDDGRGDEQGTKRD